MRYISYKKIKSLLYNIFAIYGDSTISTIGCLSIVGIVILSIWIVTRDYIFEPSIILDSIAIGIAFFIFGIVGWLAALRKVLPQFIIVRGKPAVILGVLVALICWGIAGYAVYLGLSSYFQ